jgi:hypothetical protein
MYQPTLPVTGAAGAAYLASGGPLWLALSAFAVVAAGTALERIAPRRAGAR